MLIIVMCIFFQYAFTILALAYKRYDMFAIIYLASIVFYDYIFINASYFLPSVILNVLKPYNEYLFLFLIFSFLLSTAQKITQKHRVVDRAMLFFTIPTLFVLLINDLLTEVNIGDTIMGIRMYLLPIFVPYLMYKISWFDKINYKSFLSWMFGITIFVICFGIFQRFTYDGNLQSLWFYGFFNSFPENPVEAGFYNFIRDDVLRTTSVFVSPIIYSIAVAIPSIFAVGLLMAKSDMFKKWQLILLIAFSLYGLFIAETRVGLLILIIATGIYFISVFIREKYALIFMPLLPLMAVLLTFLTLIYGYTEDMSALGRLIQYISFFDYFEVSGLGFNSEFVLSLFDTFYMSIALVYGIFVVFPFYFFFKVNRLLYKAAGVFRNREKVFAKAVYVISLTFIYSFAFQFTAGTYPFKLLFLLLFLVLAKYTDYEKSTE
jgi:hypothetical protein